MKRMLKRILKKFDLEIRRINENHVEPVKLTQDISRLRKNLYNKYLPYFELNDFSENDIKTIESVSSFTMTGPLRIKALLQSVEYIVNNNISGDIVECGVWKGGSIMLIAKKLLELGDIERNIYLYDTFEGMSEPIDIDISHDNLSASELLVSAEAKKKEGNNVWCYSSLEEVKNNIISTGYNPEKLHFIKGKVEETLSKHLPANKLALLRLDTDWYESTKSELNYLYPLLVNKGILIIDDYGQWLGQQKAVDEYISMNNLNLFLNRIDFSSRLAIKLNN